MVRKEKDKSASRPDAPPPAATSWLRGRPRLQGLIPDPGQSTASTNTFLITNYHVVSEGVHFVVRRGDNSWPARLVAYDGSYSDLVYGAQGDLAELEVGGLQALPLAIRNSSTLTIGEPVYAVGAPEGLELTISQGLISGIRDLDRGLIIQTSAAISPGSSGGGLFDSEGRLIGITSSYLKEGENLNFAIPAELAQELDFRTRSDAKFNFGLGLNFGTRPAPDRTDHDSYDLVSYRAEAEAFRRATQLSPEDKDAWEGLARAYSDLHEPSKEIDAYQRAIEIDPTDADVWEDLALARSLAGEDDKALAAWQRATALKPNDHTGLAWTELGTLYDQLGQYNQAVAAEQKAIAIDPLNDTAWFQLGVAYYALGQRADVMRVYDWFKAHDAKWAQIFFADCVQPTT